MSDVRYDHILIDTLNLYHRAYSTSKHLTTTLENGEILVTGGVFTSLKMIQKLKNDYLTENGIIYFLFDGSDFSSRDLPLEKSPGSRTFRSQVDPDYKMNRKTDKDPEFFRGLNFFQLLLLSYDDNFVIIDIPDVEADDLVLPLVESIPNDDMILMVSTDFDWARKIGPNIHWYTNKGIYDDDRFKEDYGFLPENKSLQLYKSFRGDSSDNIPKGVPGIRESILVQLVQDYDTLNDIFHNLENIDYLSDTWKNKISENKSRLRLNYKLVDFYPIDVSVIEKYTFPCKFEPNVLREFYTLFGFNLNQIDHRVPPKEDDEETVAGFFQSESIPRI